MEDVMMVGIRLFIVGMGVTFLALGLLIFVMRGLQALFPGDEKPQEIALKKEDDQIFEQSYEEMAVALAVGICLLEREGALGLRDATLGQLLED